MIEQAFKYIILALIYYFTIKHMLIKYKHLIDVTRTSTF